MFFAAACWLWPAAFAPHPCWRSPIRMQPMKSSSPATPLGRDVAPASVGSLSSAELRERGQSSLITDCP